MITKTEFSPPFLMPAIDTTYAIIVITKRNPNITQNLGTKITSAGLLSSINHAVKPNITAIKNRIRMNLRKLKISFF